MFRRLFGGSRNVTTLIKALGDEDSQQAQAAARELIALGPEAVAPLIVVLADPRETWLRRKNATALLGQLGAPEAVDPLIAALGDGNRNVQQGAAWALGKMKVRRAAPALLERLADPTSSLFTKASCLAALGAIDTGEATQGVLIAVKQLAGFERELDAGDVPSELAAEAERARVMHGDDLDESVLMQHLRLEIDGFRREALAAICRRLGRGAIERLRSAAKGDARQADIVERLVREAGIAAP